MMQTGNRVDRFRSSGAFENVHGWLGQKIVDVLDIVDQDHETRGVQGHALEIGVFQGLFFIALMSALREEEVAVATDIFDQQELNIDNSGRGDETFRIFNDNVTKFSPNPGALRILQGDSMVLSSDKVLDHSHGEKFRFISVDGGHTAEHVMNDLDLASRLLVGGGMIFLDDFFGPHWPGVTEGFMRFMSNANRNLAPVIFTDNKLMLTTISDQPRLVNLMKQLYSPGDGRYLAEVSLFGFRYVASS